MLRNLPPCAKPCTQVGQRSLQTSDTSSSRVTGLTKEPLSHELSASVCQRSFDASNWASRGAPCRRRRYVSVTADSASALTTRPPSRRPICLHDAKTPQPFV